MTPVHTACPQNESLHPLAPFAVYREWGHAIGPRYCQSHLRARTRLVGSRPSSTNEDEVERRPFRVIPLAAVNAAVCAATSPVGAPRLSRRKKLVLFRTCDSRRLSRDAPRHRRHPRACRRQQGEEEDVAAADQHRARLRGGGSRRFLISRLKHPWHFRRTGDGPATSTTHRSDDGEGCQVRSGGLFLLPLLLLLPHTIDWPFACCHRERRQYRDWGALTGSTVGNRVFSNS